MCMDEEVYYWGSYISSPSFATSFEPCTYELSSIRKKLTAWCFGTSNFMSPFRWFHISSSIHFIFW